MDRWLSRIARLLGAAIGAFAGIVAVQLMRLRRMEFLPGHPGFYINHVVRPAAPTSGRPLRLAVLGDSTTAGVGVSRPEDALPYLIASRMAEEAAAPVHVVSYGWAGARMADVAGSQLRRALEPLRAHEQEPFLPGADAVAIVVGANDATHQTNPRRFRADLRRLLTTVRRSAPKARIVLAGIPALRGALPQIEPLIFIADSYARLLRPIGRDEAAVAGVAYADLAAEVPPRIRGRDDVLSEDNFHPSVVGYTAWADVIHEALRAGPSGAGSATSSIAG
jgi:lysophospholipase L1-like esterase